MKKTYVYLLALPSLMVGCTRATFLPIVGSDSGAGGSPDAKAADALICSAPGRAWPCTPLSSSLLCDPGCQVGKCPDWCTQKCTIAGDGNAVCTTFGSDGDGQSCIVTNESSPARRDTCIVGDICLGDSSGAFAHCYSLCGSKDDCKGEACTPRQVAPVTPDDPVIHIANVCDPVYQPCSSLLPGKCCNPVGGKQSTCSLNQICYLLAAVDPVTQDNSTVCEYVSGLGAANVTCRFSRECAPGWFCASDGFCHKACDVNATGLANVCTGSSSCTRYGNQYGLCFP